MLFHEKLKNTHCFIKPNLRVTSGKELCKWYKEGTDCSVIKNPHTYAEDAGSIPGLGRSPGGGNGNPLQYSCLENFIDRGASRATVHGVTKSWTRLSNWTHTNDITPDL